MGNIAAVISLIGTTVENTIMADANTDIAPEGYFLVDITSVDCAPGWIYDSISNTFTNPFATVEVTVEATV